MNFQTDISAILRKNVLTRSFSDPYSVRMWQNMDQKISEYENFSSSARYMDFLAIFSKVEYKTYSVSYTQVADT